VTSGVVPQKLAKVHLYNQEDDDMHPTPKTMIVAVLIPFGLAVVLLLLVAADVRPPAIAAGPLAPKPFAEPVKRMSPGPDLAVQRITLSPPNPAPGQPTTITVVIKNIGTSAVVDGFYTYLYIDPSQQPPTPTTPDTSYIGWFLGLNAGATFTWSYTDYEFTTEGCSHVVYAWVDRDEGVTEDDETNNLIGMNICVGGVGDAYEPDDNACASATILPTNGTVQSHNFYPAGDQDWYQFTGVGGVEYVITARNVGANSDAALSLFSRCDLPPSFGDSRRVIRVPLPTSGTYYVKAMNHNISATTQTSYTISIEAPFDCSGNYEPNDTRGTARDMPTDGTVQRHTFCRPGDEDWVEFATQAGITYTVRAIGIGPDADPTLMGVDPSNPAHSVITNPLLFAAPANGTYYVQATNMISTAYGPTTAYSLTVSVQACSADAFEPDDSRAEARPVTVNGGIQSRTACPAGDRDWARFSAAAGVTHTLETVGLGVKSDTILCLYDNIGTQIACDDESGVNHGSRITWQATASGEYFVEVRQATDQYAGHQTAYEFSVVTGVCRPDLYEPDDTADTPNLALLHTDGSRQLRSFCPANDRDWARLSIPAEGAYTVQTSALGPGSDTVLNLYDIDRTMLLASNDDHGPGLASQIVYSFTQAGMYYVESRHFNPARYGRGTNYQLSAVTGTPTPPQTPEPGQPPPATPPPTPPPPSGIQTLIVTNRERLTAIYGTSRTSQLFGKLATLANHPVVQGEILQVEGNDAVAAAYAAWIADPVNVPKANQVANVVRGIVMDYLAAHPSVQYIILVGDDRVVPFRRIRDRTGWPESEYTTVSVTTTVGAACAHDYFLTDDYYADREPGIWLGAELYIPDWAIGRLVETPEQIGGMIDAFMTSSELSAEKALVVGYDFVQDVAANICELYGHDLGNARLDCTLIGDSWNTDQLRDKQLNAVPPFKLQSINGHASHASQGGPIGSAVSARDIVSGTGDLRGALVYSPGCHSGLNVPEASESPLDLPEAFLYKQANYAGNTGFGWGSRVGIQFSERLMQNYTQELVKGASATIGRALMAAKQRYYQEADSFEETDEKALQQVVLYGLPMYRLNTGAILGDEDPFPSVVISPTLPILPHQTHDDGTVASLIPLDQTGKARLDISLRSAGSGAVAAAKADGLVPVSTAWGDYFQLDGHISTQSNSPILPRLYVHLVAPAPQQSLRGVVFAGGSYYTSTIDPVIDVAVNEYVTVTGEPAFQADGFYPPVPFLLQTNDVISRPDSALTVVMGQYDSASAVQRLYNDLQYDVYFSTSTDQTGPTITSIDGYYNTRASQATFKVEANDPFTVTRVLVAYTTGAGSWSSLDLNYNNVTYKWSGSLPGMRGASYYVQAVDSAGNATAVSRKGGYFDLTEVDLAVERYDTFLPAVMK
jgi:hypothetical protein